MNLEIFRLNKFGCRIVPADPTLLGSAHKEALKFCGPFVHANGAGWWVYPPLDMDVTYDGKEKWYNNILSEYPNDEKQFLLDCAKKFGSKAIDIEKEVIGPHSIEKSKYSFGNVEPDVFQFWSGCVFKMPPNWSLLVTNPINIGLKNPFSVQNGIIECDWLRVDHWFNFKWTRPFEWAKIRRDQAEPIAQLIPIYRPSYDRNEWKIQESSLYEDGATFEEWDKYYYEKFVKESPEKDPTTYHRTRKEEIAKCPYHH